MNCPVCGSRSTGKVGVDQYYCWDCCVEYKQDSNRGMEIYTVDEDGTLVSFCENDI